VLDVTTTKQKLEKVGRRQKCLEAGIKEAKFQVGL
jgi:hypothetical protein